MPSRIDWRIPLQVRTPHIQSPMDSYSRSMQLRGQEQAGQIRNLQQRKLQKENRKLEREAQGLQVFNDLMRDNLTFNDDGTTKTKRAAIRSGLIKAGYSDLAQQYEKGRLAHKKSLADMELSELNLFSKQSTMIAGMAGQILKDPKAYPSVLEEAKQAGLDVSKWPAEYSDELRPKLQGALYSSLSGKEMIDLEIKRKDPARVQEWYEFVAQTLAPYKTQRGWTKGRDFLKAKGVPEGVMALIPEQYSPEASQAVVQRGLKPNQRNESSPTEGAIKRRTAFEAYAEKRGLNPANLTPDQRMEAQRDYNESTRARTTPKKPADTTQADQRRSAEAEYQRDTRIHKIDADEEKELLALEESDERDEFGLEAERIREKYEKRREGVEKVYRAKIGESSAPGASNGDQIPLWDIESGVFQ